MSDSDLTVRIRRRAYEIWEREGRPDNRQTEHWLKAERQLLEEGLANAKGRKSKKTSTSEPPMQRDAAKATSRARAAK